MAKFQKGDRVKFSARAFARGSRQFPKRIGTVVSPKPIHGEVYSVLWDGLKRPTRYHEDFLEKVYA